MTNRDRQHVTTPVLTIIQVTTNLPTYVPKGSNSPTTRWRIT
jgi:hypothetical protein